MFSGNFTNLNYNPIQTYKRALGHLSSQDHNPAWTSYSAASDEELSDSPRPYSDETIYYMLIMTHTLSVVSMIVNSILKKMKRMELIGEFLRNAFGSVVYIGVIIYCIYKDRLARDSDVEPEDGRVPRWIRYEIGNFFAWLTASAVFIQFAYWSKFSSVWNSNSERLQLE